MKKINEFLNSDNKSKIISLLDRFIFFDGEWMFPDNVDYLYKIVNNIIPVDE